MEKESKVDVNLISTCHGCLSTDRTIQPLAENSDMFVQMLGTHRHCLVYGLDDIRMCWECSTTLKKMKSFQTQVRRAQTGLMKMLYEIDSHVDSLSKLKITNKDYFDQDIKHRGHKKLKKNNEKLETITIIKTEFGDIQTYSEGDNAVYTDSNTDNIDEPDNKVDEFDNNSNEADTKLDEVDNKDFDAFNELIDNKKSISIAKEENVNVSFDVKEEDLKAIAPVKVKRPRRRRDTKCVNNVVGYYKRYASLVKTVKKDWGSLEDVRSHFKAVQFSEQEMEDHFITKDRRNISYERLPHKCELCIVGYTKEDDLKRHNDLNHHKQGAPYKCTMCNKKQSSIEALAAHWKLHSVVFRCRTCGDVCKENFMRKHLDHAHTRTYDCSVCHAKFGTLKLFTIHYKQLHMTYVCDYCNHTLTTKKKMEKHISEHHMGYQCKECNRGYKNYIYYKKHCYSLHPHKVNPKVDLELSFCVECNKQFPSIDKYKTHLRVSSKHNKKKNVSLPCPECGKIFCRKKNLNYHYNLFHLKKTKYYCEICDKYFARPSGLRTHRQNVHLKVEKVKDKICDLCGRAFSSHVVLRHHRRTHTGERPHKCPHCAAEFIQKYAMQTHVRTQHKEFVNKDFVNKDFVNKDFVNKDFVNKDFVNKELNKEQQKKPGVAPVWPETGYFV